jgi:hypothetical protein
MFQISKIAFGMVLACGIFLSSSANASECHVPQCYWKTVTTYVCVQRPVVHYVKKYYSCGTPYYQKVVSYRTVKVPVQQRVKICR